MTVLETVGAVAGYTTYIDLIRPLLTGQRIIATGMTREIERVETAIDTALAGTPCAIVSSGDPGIYAMAGLALEICANRGLPVAPAGSVGPAPAEAGGLVVEVVPGIPALGAGASLLGAPLTHDFAAVSLSDLLTPWERIEERIEAAARADFVVVFYNPKSRKRRWQLERAREILLRHRDGRTPVGVVRAAMRPEQQVSIVTLEELNEAEADMQTIVFVGSSASYRYADFMITPRGYSGKYPKRTHAGGREDGAAT